MVLTWLPCCREKWFHITRLYMVLDHDSKNQEALHVPSSTDRYNNLQCRQAVQTQDTRVIQAHPAREKGEGNTAHQLYKLPQRHVANRK